MPRIRLGTPPSLAASRTGGRQGWRGDPLGAQA